MEQPQLGFGGTAWPFFFLVTETLIFLNVSAYLKLFWYDGKCKFSGELEQCSARKE